jgi:hypothetical protein
MAFEFENVRLWSRKWRWSVPSDRIWSPSWIANSPECEGIGTVKAERLYNAYVPRLLITSRKGKTDLLSKSLTWNLLKRFAWHLKNTVSPDTLLWMDRLGIPRKDRLEDHEIYGIDAQFSD